MNAGSTAGKPTMVFIPGENFDPSSRQVKNKKIVVELSLCDAKHCPNGMRICTVSSRTGLVVVEM